MPDNGGGSGLRQVGGYLGLAFLLPLCTFIGLAIGYLLDKAFGTHFLRIVFLLFGIAAGFIELLREVNRNSKG
jgi:F0F1-type ATP synthase assembly protein I